MKHRKPRRADWRKKPAKKKITERAFVFQIRAMPDQFELIPFRQELVEMSFGFSVKTTANGDGTYTHTFTAPAFDA